MRFTSRSFDAIKSRRKLAAYRSMVEELTKAMGNCDHHQSPPVSPAQVRLPPVLEDSPMDETPAVDAPNYNLDESTEMYMSPEIYLERLNSYESWRKNYYLADEEKFSSINLSLSLKLIQPPVKL